jgi:MFS family permease
MDAQPDVRRARWAITAIFALNGSLFASAFARLPAIQDRTGISEGQLGLALLLAMVGLLASQPVAGALVSRFGSRPVVRAGAIGYALGLVPVALSESFGALAASMFAIGLLSGPLDVAMNVHGLTIERRLGRAILSSLHAAFSFGVFAICAVLSEGAVSDWAAIYLDDEVGTGEGTAAAGLAVFSLTMGIGRLAGDRLSEAVGPARLARGGGSLGAVGIGIALLADTTLTALAGFALAGLGLAALFPLALRAAATRGDSPGPAVAAVSAMGYIGFLAGPPTIGGLAELVGLRAALLLVVACCAAAAALAGAVRVPKPAATTAR